MDFTGDMVLSAWRRAQALPLGTRALSWVLGKLVPYTGTVSPRIERLEKGYAEATMRDRRRVRNHLRSVHALALANLAEFAGSLAIVTRIPEDKRWIVTGLEYDYLKKARGTLTARCDFREDELPEDGECLAKVGVFDESGTQVVAARVRLKVGPKKKRPPSPAT